jgi:hypothetical protein
MLVVQASAVLTAGLQTAGLRAHTCTPVLPRICCAAGSWMLDPAVSIIHDMLGMCTQSVETSDQAAGGHAALQVARQV